MPINSINNQPITAINSSTANAKLDQKLEKLDQIIENEDTTLESNISKRSYSPNSNSVNSSRTSIRQNSGSLTDGEFVKIISKPN